MQAKSNNGEYPLVSVLSFVKNAARSIRRSIESLLAQDYPNVEIIVQDGASTDGTLEILESYGDKINLVSEPDSSPLDGFSRALARITGEFFGSCLSDEELLPHAVSWAVENLLKYPHVAAIYGDHYITDIDGNITGQVRPGEWNFEKYFCSEWTPPFCASFFRRVCYEALGFREYKAADEFDLWINLGVKFPIRYVPGMVVAKYAVHPGESSLQPHQPEKRATSRKTAIKRLCNNPQTPEWIRSLHDKAIASLYPWRVESYCSMGAWDVAKKHAPEAFENGPNPERLRFLAARFYHRALELKRNGALEEALGYLDMLVKYNVVGSALNYQRAEILLKLGRINEAAKASYEELKLQPEHKASQEIIEQEQPHVREKISVEASQPSFRMIEKKRKNASESSGKRAGENSLQYPSFNALVSFLSSRDNYRPTIISTAEVFCGPDCETTMDADEYRTIKSPAGVYDIEQIAKRLPSSQTPQLVAVKADATGRNFPINLQALKCPKLLILGNTQHLQTPIQALLKYALQEKFDFIMSDHKRHHLHYFKEIGFEKVFWLPAFNISPHKQPYYEDKRYKVTFVGQAGKWHPYRKYILQYLKANGVPVNYFQLPPPKAAEIYAQSLVNLNVSLNGDLNLRVFEVLSSGGFLLTDKLTMESGLELLFKDGQHLVCFENDRDLLDKIQYFLKHPDEAKAIAQNGYEEFERNHTPEKKIKELNDYILSGELNSLYDIKKDKRSIYVKTDSPIELVRRVALYEFFQEVHLTTTSALILFWPEVDGRLACDVLDLPRLRLFIKNDSEQIPDQNTRLFQNTDMAERIKLVTTEQLRQMDLFWNALVITASELLTAGLENLLTSMKFKWLVISDGFDALEEQQKKKFKDILAAAGFEKSSEGLEIYYWKDKNLWGEILYSENKIAEAIRCFGQALLENPSHCDALNNLGVISCQFEQLENAEKLLLKAVRLNRRNANALINLAHLYLRMKRFDDATELFQEAASLDKDDPSLWFHLGICYEQSNRNPEALQAYKRCNELGTSEWPVAEKIQTLEKRTAAKRPKRTSKVILPTKRILVINNLYPPQELGGYGRLLCDFTNILENRGHSIYVLTSDTPYLGPIDQDQPNVDRSLLLFGSWQNGICGPIGDKEKILQIIKKNDEKLQNVIKHFSPQLCLLGNIDFLSPSIFQTLLKNGIPVIHHLGNSNPGYSVQDTPKSRFYHLATASNWLKEEILKQGYSLHQIGVIYPGALVKEFKMSVLPALDKLRIAYASIILPYKGPHILINALKKLHDMGVDFSCSLAGTSTDEKFVNSLKNFITQAGMDEKVTFPGFLPRKDLKNFFARHNVLVFPSVFQEPFGISQVEAMAAGLTVVTSGTGGAKEIIEHRRSGVIFNSGDHESLARELLQLTGDKERWRQIALAGQKRALQSFDIEKSVDDIERIYCHLAQHDENGIEHGRKIHSLYERDIVGKKNGTPHISPIPLHTNDSNPLVSIIMPAYNAAEYIAEAIESVLIQNYRNFELIIVDDGSTDNTKDIIAGFKDEKIKYFYKENAGAASARNLAMKESKGDFLITLDADDMMAPDFIAKHLQQFEKHPETDLVYCDDYLIDEDGKPTRVSENPEYPDRKSLIRDLFRYGCPIVPFRTCIRKSVFDKIGFFDEDLLVGEDYDMMRRFVKSGLKIHHLKDALYLRRITPNNLLRNSTAQNAKCHFEVVKRFADTFAYDELFPDVSWDQIPPEMRQLHAKCLTAATYVAIGHAYIESNSPAYAERASKLACSELNDCLKIDPNNRQIRQLLQKYELLQAKWAEESPTSYSIGKHKINN